MKAKLFTCIQIDMPYTWGYGQGSIALRCSGEQPPGPVLIVRNRPAAPQQVLVVDSAGVPDERQAREWLASSAPAGAAEDAFQALNRALFAWRIAAADPETFELAPDQARAIVAGWGSGPELAAGRLAETRALGFSADHPTGALRKRKRTRSSAATENSRDGRFNALLAGRSAPLPCEELALRASHDLRAGRLGLAAIELERALAGALQQLRPAAGEAPARLQLPKKLGEAADLHARIAPLAAAASAGDFPAAVEGSAAPASADAELIAQVLEQLQVLLAAHALHAADAAG